MPPTPPILPDRAPPLRVDAAPAGAPPKPAPPPLPPEIGEGEEPVGGASGPVTSGEVVQGAASGKKARDTVSRFPCSRCGAKLEFAPGTMSLTCRYCGQFNEIAGKAGGEGVEELDYLEYAQHREAASATDEVETIHCNTCSADVQRPSHVTSLSCPYCGSNIVATGVCRKFIKPNAVLPFVLTRDEAIVKFRAWLASRWFAPNALKKQGKLDAALTGLYVPHWTYDAFTRTQYTGYRGEAYYVTVRSGNTTTRVRKVRWYPASGVVDNRFDDVLVCASKSLTPKQADEIAPWDLKAAVPYQDAFLSGFVAESYQVSLVEGFERAKGLMEPIIAGSVRRDIGGDEQRISSMRTSYSDVTFKHILTPVWITAYRYMNKVYNTMINARTGEVIGQRPYSAWKITLFVLMCLAIVGIIVLIANSR